MSVLLLLAALTTSSQDPSHSRESANSVAQLIEARNSSVSSVDVAYRYYDHAAADEAYIYRRLTFYEDDSIRLEVSHGSKSRPWQSWPKRVRHHVVGGTIFTFWPNELLSAETQVGDKALPLDLLEDPFLRATGWWPIVSRFRSGSFQGVPYALADALAQTEYVSLPLGRNESLVHWKSKNDYIVLNTELGHALVERRWHAPDDSARMSVFATKFRCVAEGVWWPEQIDTTFFGATLFARAQTSVRLRGYAEFLRANSGGSMGLAFKSVPGLARLSLETGHVEQVNSGGLWLLEARAIEAQRLASDERRGKWSPGTVALLAGCSIILLMRVSRCLLRRVSRSSTNAEA